MGPIHLTSIQGHLLPHGWGEPGSEQHRAESSGSVSLCVCVCMLTCISLRVSYIHTCHASTHVISTHFIRPQVSCLYTCYTSTGVTSLHTSYIHRRHVSTRVTHLHASYIHRRHTPTRVVSLYVLYIHMRHMATRVMRYSHMSIMHIFRFKYDSIIT